MQLTNELIFLIKSNTPQFIWKSLAIKMILIVPNITFILQFIRPHRNRSLRSKHQRRGFTEIIRKSHRHSCILKLSHYGPIITIPLDSSWFNKRSFSCFYIRSHVKKSCKPMEQQQSVLRIYLNAFMTLALILLFFLWLKQEILFSSFYFLLLFGQKSFHFFPDLNIFRCKPV